MTATAVDAPAAGAPPRRRTLTTACAAHALHDGFADMLYLLFPIWQAELALSLTQVGTLRTVYSGAMAIFQIPAGLLAERFGERWLLALGTALAGLGLALASLSGRLHRTRPVPARRRPGRRGPASAELVAGLARVRRPPPARRAEHLQLRRRRR